MALPYQSLSLFFRHFSSCSLFVCSHKIERKDDGKHQYMHYSVYKHWKHIYWKFNILWHCWHTSWLLYSQNRPGILCYVCARSWRRKTRNVEADDAGNLTLTYPVKRTVYEKAFGLVRGCTARSFQSIVPRTIHTTGTGPFYISLQIELWWYTYYYWVCCHIIIMIVIVFIITIITAACRWYAVVIFL